MSLLLLASMPAASPDGPSDAEEGERRRGINAPPEMGNKKCPCLASGGRIPHRIVVSSHCVFWPSVPRRPAPPPAPDPAQGRAPTRTGTRLRALASGCGLWLPAADLGLDRLLGHELGPGERRPLPSHTPALPCDGCTAPPSFATLDTWRFPTNGYSTPSAGRRSSIRRNWRSFSASRTPRFTVP